MKVKFLVVIWLYLILVGSVSVVFAGLEAGCRASFINPLADIRWEGVFPIQIAGTQVKMHVTDYASEGLETDPDKLGPIVCVCRQGARFTFGLTLSYWEPARIIEVTKIPYCFPTLGMKLREPKAGAHLKSTGMVGGSTRDDTSTGSGNSHYYFFNAFDILDLFVDIPCTRHEGFDIAYVSEIDPMWNNDVLNFVINPESILFGNPVAQASCVADSVAASIRYPINTLFWCVGSWGSAYPLTGSTNVSDTIKNSALIQARTIYREARLGLLWDPAVDECYAGLTPVWIKTNYKVHLVKPVKGPIIPLGRATVLWETTKNPPFGTQRHSPDNFSYLMFRRVKCCLGKTFGQ